MKEALCVAVIWLFIVGIPLSIRYNLFLFPFISALATFVEYWLRKKYNVAFLPRRFLNWLYATWVWDMFVVRSKGNPKASTLKKYAWGCFFIGSGFLYIVHTDTFAAIDLDEMRVVTGTFENFERNTGRRSCGDMITLRLEDGRVENFWRRLRKEDADYLSHINGQKVTVWLQTNRDHLNPQCRKFEEVQQLQHDDHIVGLPYNKTHSERTKGLFLNIAKALFGIGLLCLLRVWRINRRMETKLT